MLLIGLLGRAGSGKDTVAAFVRETIDAATFAFATSLKQEASRAFGVDPRLFDERAIKEVPLQQLALTRCTMPEFVDFASELARFDSLKPRTIMQAYGDFRRQQHPGYFLRPAYFAWSDAQTAGRAALVITDVRYPNEAEWVKTHGGLLWRVERTGLAPVNSHSSEWSLRDYPVDATIRNFGSLDDLRRTVVDLLGLAMDREAQS